MSNKEVAVGLVIKGDSSDAVRAVDTVDNRLDGLDGSTKKLSRSADAVDASFAKLGIRSAKQIEADLLQINQELVKLASRTDLSGAEFDRAWVAGQARIKQLRAELDGASGDVDHVARRSSNLLGLMGSLGVAFSGAALAQEFIRVNIELENTERTFRAVTGSVDAASQEMEFARDVANRLGLEQISTAKSYADLLAATKGTAAEGKATRDIFEAVSRSMSLAGKSAADTQGALNALSQMASKGVVQMEELRGQLGERLPGAMKAAADGFGITTAQLIKLTENGMLTAEELFPALSRGLNELYKDTDEAGQKTETLTQKWEHFKNAVADAFKTMGDNGGLALLKGGLDAAEAAVVSVSVGFVALGKTIGVFFAALAAGDIGWNGFGENAKKAFAEIEKEASDKLIKAAMHNETLAGSLNATEKAALAAAIAHEKTAAAAKAEGEKAREVSADWTKLNVAYGELEDSAQKATKQAVANAEATNAQAESVAALGKAFGTVTDKLEANERAARSNAEAAERVAAARREELAIVKAHLASLEEETRLQGFATEQQEKTIETLRKSVEARQADADKADQQAEKSRVVAATAQAESEAYRDNSARLGELKEAYEQAKIKVDALRAAKEQGADVTRQLAAAEIEAGKAALLYRDAAKDQTAAVEANEKARKSQQDVATAGIRLEIEQMRTMAELCKAYGDETAASGFLSRAKQLEIELAELTAKGKHAEAEAALLAIKAKREELIASGELTKAKEAELKAQEAAAQVKEIEAKIADETAERMRGLAWATDEAAASADKAKGSYDGLNSALNGVGAAADSAATKVAALNTQTSTTRTAAGGTSAPAGIDFKSLALGRGATAANVDAVAEAANGELTRILAARTAAGATTSDQTLKSLISLAVDTAIAANNKSSKTTTTSPAASQTVKVDLRTNAGVNTVNVQSTTDMNALLATLTELQTRGV